MHRSSFIFGLPFGRCSLDVLFFIDVPGVKFYLSHFLLQVPLNHLLQLDIVGRFAFLSCISAGTKPRGFNSADLLT